MNNLAIILEQVLEARKISTEQAVVEKLDEVIQTIIDMMKAQTTEQPTMQYPNYPAEAQPIPVSSPYGGLEVYCVEEPVISAAAKDMARKFLGRS